MSDAGKVARGKSWHAVNPVDFKTVAEKIAPHCPISNFLIYSEELGGGKQDAGKIREHAPLIASLKEVQDNLSFPDGNMQKILEELIKIKKWKVEVGYVAYMSKRMRTLLNHSNTMLKKTTCPTWLKKALGLVGSEADEAPEAWVKFALENREAIRTVPAHAGKKETKDKTKDIFIPEGARDFDTCKARFKDGEEYALPDLLVSDWKEISEDAEKGQGHAQNKEPLWAELTDDGRALTIVKSQDKRDGVLNYMFYALKEDGAQICMSIEKWFLEPEDALKLLTDLAQDYKDGKIKGPKACKAHRLIMMKSAEWMPKMNMDQCKSLFPKGAGNMKRPAAAEEAGHSEGPRQAVPSNIFGITPTPVWIGPATNLILCGFI